MRTLNWAVCKYYKMGREFAPYSPPISEVEAFVKEIIEKALKEVVDATR